jgi:hypothetical protein
VEQNARRRATDLPDGASGIFAREGMDGAKRFEWKSEISFYAHAISGRK